MLENKKCFAVAIDLPGISDSLFPGAPLLKHEIAGIINKVVNKLAWHAMIIAGHDVGGQIVFLYIQEYPNEIKSAVIMEVVIPGLNPWNSILKNPNLWHFAFYSISELPEILVAGNQKDYLEYFYNAIAAVLKKIIN